MTRNVHYLAMAYRWVLVPTEVADFDVVLILSSCSGSYKGSDSTHRLDSETRVYHSKLPEKGSRHELSDVSGCLGLLHPVSDVHAERKVAAFERLVADVVLWRLAEAKFHATEKTIILLQGPLLPKLRGRLMYRGISDRVTFCALTYEPEWFRRIEAADQSYRLLLDSNRTGFSSVYPPRALDRGTRSWVYRSASGFPLHFEIVTNLIDCSLPARDWISELEGTLNLLVRPTLSSESGFSVLPDTFAVATKAAEEIKDREEAFVSFLLGIRGVNYDLNELAKIPKHAEMFEYLKATQLPLPDGGYRCLADCARRDDEEALYTLFKEAWVLRSQELAKASKHVEPILVLERETQRTFGNKEVRILRNELWEGIESVVISKDRPSVRRYLQKVAEEALRGGPERSELVRGIFLDRRFTLPEQGREVFNRLKGEVIIERIARVTGVQP